MKPLSKPSFYFWLSLLRGLRDLDIEPLHPWLCRDTSIIQISDIVFPSVKYSTITKDSFQESGARYDKDPRPLPVKFAGPKLNSTFLCQFLPSYQVPFQGILLLLLIIINNELEFLTFLTTFLPLYMR